MFNSLEQIRQRLESLIEINQLLMGTIEPEELLRKTIDATIRLFSIEGCSIGLLDETSDELAFVATAGPAEAEEFRIKKGQGIAGWVAETGQPVIANDVSQDPRWFGGVDKKTGFHTKSALCVPLKQHDRIIGVIEALNTTSTQGFTQEDLQLFMAFAGLAATAIDRAELFTSVQHANIVFQETIQDRYHLVTGNSPSMQEVLRLARTVATTPITVLLLGESGTGKEVVARAIHQWSPRAERPFVAVNCVALTSELLESELFGHEKGAFTGAVAQKKGKFELAAGGTIFLDEIGDLAPNLQAKLLRVLQEKEFQRVGGVKDIRADVRILAATNRDLRQALQNGGFREDLYYRLNVASLLLPPLRERRDDISSLVWHFIERLCHEMKRPVLGLDTGVMNILSAYPWPGNIRELRNTIERAVVLAAGPNISVGDLPTDVRQQASQQSTDSSQTTQVQVIDGTVDETVTLAESIETLKRSRIKRALAATHGSQTKAAQILGLPQSNLSRLMKKLGLR